MAWFYKKRNAIRIKNDLTVNLAVLNGSDPADMEPANITLCRLELVTNKEIYIDVPVSSLSVSGNIVSFPVIAANQRILGDYYLRMEYNSEGEAHSLKVYCFTFVDLSSKQYTIQDPGIPVDIYVQAVVSINIPPESLRPYIGSNGNWFVGGVDTGVPATGAAGVGIVTVAINSSGHLIVTLTNGNTIDAGSVYQDDLVTQAQLDLAINNLQSQITLNQAAISNLATEVDGLREQLNDRTHNKGLFANEAAIRAIPNPIDGDFADNIETQTRWTYSFNPTTQIVEWWDSGVGVDINISLSDSLPLVDGVASAGTENEASRGDHRHPSDTTKQDVLVPGENIDITGNVISAISTPLQIHTLLYVDGNSTANSEDGSIYAPYKTIQAGINALQFGYGLVIAYGEYALDNTVIVNDKHNNSIFAIGFSQQWRTKIDADWNFSDCSRIEFANIEIGGSMVMLNCDGMYISNVALTGSTRIESTGYHQLRTCQLTGLNILGSPTVDVYDCTEESRITASGITRTTMVWTIGGTASIPLVTLRNCRWCVPNHASGRLRIQYCDLGFDNDNVSLYSAASTVTGGRLFLESGTAWQPHGACGTIQQTGDAVYTIGSFEYEPTGSNTFSGQRRDGFSLHSSQLYDHNARSGYTKTSDTLEGHFNGISNQFETITAYFPLSLQTPADDSQVVRTATDVQINAHKLNWNGAGYTGSDEQIVVPSADPSHAGAYPAEHYVKVQNLPTTIGWTTISGSISSTSPIMELQIGDTDLVIRARWRDAGIIDLKWLTLSGTAVVDWKRASIYGDASQGSFGNGQAITTTEVQIDDVQSNSDDFVFITTRVSEQRYLITAFFSGGGARSDLAYIRIL